MALTGWADGPPLAGPCALVDLVDHAAEVLCRQGGGTRVDGLALLGERAALSHLARRGAISCGGGARLVRSTDGWLAVSLSRPEDVAALPAWLGRDVPAHDPWPAVTEAAASMPSSVLDERAALLGLPIAALGSVAPPATGVFDLPVGGRRVEGRGAPPLPIVGALVVDLSALWAGPLCGQLLAATGAHVIKIESTGRPDGARRGPAPFFDLLNGAKRSVALDLTTAQGRHQLRAVVGGADVVIESARPRALHQMGIDALEVLHEARGPSVWASITSHGRGPRQCQRVGFGDVAAAAGGLVAGDEADPCFLADAVADPLTGLVTAAAVLEALSTGGHWLIDAAMAPIAASVAGSPLVDVRGESARPPRARPVIRRAPALGSDTQSVLRELLS
jgi:CoA-transferase family III